MLALAPLPRVGSSTGRASAQGAPVLAMPPDPPEAAAAAATFGQDEAAAPAPAPVVNKSVAARCVSTPEAFRKFAELVNDGPFRELLAQARENPKGPEATKVLRRVLPFINLAAKAVPWGNRERAAET